MWANSLRAGLSGTPISGAVPAATCSQIRDDELVQLAGHDPGVGCGEELVDVGHLLVAPGEWLPEEAVGAADAAVERGLHVNGELTHDASFRC
jgi:hypothetical protein